MAFDAHLEPDRLEPDAALRHFLDRLDGDGAIVSFVGVARGRNREGEPVSGLHLDHHPRLTGPSLDAIVREARARFAISDAMVIHRCGHVAAGEPIVFAAAAAPHRRVAFLAADYLMDRLKTDAMFWKREDGAAGSRWIEPTDQDHADRQRWEDDARNR